jgi:hypothetical protein
VPRDLFQPHNLPRIRNKSVCHQSTTCHSSKKDSHSRYLQKTPLSQSHEFDPKQKTTRFNTVDTRIRHIRGESTQPASLATIPLIHTLITPHLFPRGSINITIDGHNIVSPRGKSQLRCRCLLPEPPRLHVHAIRVGGGRSSVMYVHDTFYSYMTR